MSSNNLQISLNYDEYDFDEEEMEEDPEDHFESDEDTEEASETENRKVDPNYFQPEITDERDLIYLDKLNSYKNQSQQLINGTFPEYLKRCRKLELKHKERLKRNQTWREHQIELTEREFVAEKKAASKEYDEKVGELKENLLQDMEEKKKLFETERVTMELSNDSTETKPAMTRKLRRRPNDPIPVPEKRRGKLHNHTTPNYIYLLDEKEVESDLKAISRGSKSGVGTRKPGNGLQSLGPIIPDSTSSDTRIEDGKLLYEKKWFHRGQPVFVEWRDTPKFPASISAIGTESISLKKTDSSKIKIFLNQLIRGKVAIKRRAP